MTICAADEGGGMEINMENDILREFENTGYSEKSLKPDKLTLFGVLKEFYLELEEKNGFISGIMLRAWGNDTRNSHLRDYLDTLLPYVDANKAIGDFTKEDLEEALERIRNIKAEKEIGNKEPYEESTMRRFEYLFRLLFLYGNKRMGVCDDILQYTHFASADSSEDSKSSVKPKPKLRKSLDAYEEIFLFHKLFVDYNQKDGRIPALGIMYFTGLRNSEAAGITFGDFRSFTSQPDAHYMVMRQSTERGTNKLKPGGKTGNAPRKLPIPALFYHYIKKRRDYVENLIAQGEIQPFDGQEIKCLDDMPVACLGKNLNIRCSTQDIINIANKCFEEIGLDMKLLEDLDNVLYRNRYNLGDVEERDASAYLLRRNLATHLHNIQFSEAEIQYYLGHKVEVPYESRANFNNEEKLLRIYEKIERLPICLLMGPRILPDIYHEDSEKIIFSSEQGTVTISNTSHQRILIQKTKKSSTTKVYVQANEPNDELQVKFSHQSPSLKYHIISLPVKTEFSHTVNIEQAVLATYQKAFDLFERRQKRSV